MNFATELLHGGLLPDKATGATTLPIYQTAAYNQHSAEDLEKIFSLRKAGFIYSRIGNPTTATFERRISDLERGAGAVAFSSGMAAIEVRAQPIEGVAIVSTEPNTALATVKLVTVAADQRKPVLRNDVVNPLEDCFFLKVLKSLIEAYQVLVAVDENRLVAIDVYADVATAAKKIKEAVDVLGK